MLAAGWRKKRIGQLKNEEERKKSMNRVSIMMASVLLVAAVSVTVAEPKVGGGEISYKKYAGTAVITRVEKTAAADANKVRAAEGYEVWYTFTPKVKIPNGDDRRWLEQHKEHQFVLGSSGWCPGPKFLKKYGIEKGKKFAASLWVIEKGVCTPVMVKLDDVPDDDYFEATAQ